MNIFTHLENFTRIATKRIKMIFIIFLTTMDAKRNLAFFT